MGKISQTIPSEMFDFSDYYDKIANELPNGARICEIGVADGASALYLAEKMHELGKDFEMYWVENFDYGGRKQIAEVVKNICRSGLGEKITLMPYSSLDASTMFNDNFLDFCFLDSSHEYHQTKAEIWQWWFKVKSDCILAGHDYHLYEGVKQAVHDTIPSTMVISTEIGNYQSLEIIETTKGYGIFSARKNWQSKIRYEF